MKNLSIDDIRFISGGEIDNLGETIGGAIGAELGSAFGPGGSSVGAVAGAVIGDAIEDYYSNLDLPEFDDSWEFDTYGDFSAFDY
ncbi:hypothetical protein ACLSYZ_05665 [Avibacterium avium]|uniref:hypothetical protein n=1 Tax=Avibacterium TaxID=292486 RepID=UPI0039FD75B7